DQVHRRRQGWKQQGRSWQGVSDHDGVKQRGGFGRAGRAPEPHGKSVATYLATQCGAGETLVADRSPMALAEFAAYIEPESTRAALRGKKWLEQMALYRFVHRGSVAPDLQADLA